MWVTRDYSRHIVYNFFFLLTRYDMNQHWRTSISNLFMAIGTKQKTKLKLKKKASKQQQWTRRNEQASNTKQYRWFIPITGLCAWIYIEISLQGSILLLFILHGVWCVLYTSCTKITGPKTNHKQQFAVWVCVCVWVSAGV